MFSVDYNQESPLEFHIPEPFQCPSIYGWIQACLTTKSLVPFLTLPGIVANRSETLTKYTQNLHHWHKLTPRTLLFVQFFSLLRPDWSAAQFVEGLSSAGMDPQFMETLPEAIHAPLQEAIVECQTNPPSTWSKELLAMVGREDVNILLSPGQRPRHTQSTLLVCLCYNLFFSH
jgi:anaphase-promoting complex subunit 1